MTEKRFRVLEHCLRSSYGIEAENWLVTNDNHAVVLNNKEEAHMVANMSNDVIDKLNALHEENEQLKQSNQKLNDELQETMGYLALKSGVEKENEQLKSRVEYLERKIDRERTSYQKQHEKWEEEIQKENEQLKQALKNSYINEICENCKYGHYWIFSETFGYGKEGEFECTKKHFGNEHWKCDGLTECNDFELNLKGDVE